MVSPTEGEDRGSQSGTAEGSDPAAAATLTDKGWVATVHVPDEESTTRNLVPAGLVRNWMREAVTRLYARQPQLAGAVAADGGRPADDLLAGMPDANWKEVTGEFFLTA